MFIKLFINKMTLLTSCCRKGTKLKQKYIIKIYKLALEIETKEIQTNMTK